jgi:DNA-binding IclR family transcriptional regulator
MSSANLESLIKGLEVIETAARLGTIRGATLAKANGWSRAQASRYLGTLAERGWLKNVGTETRPVYILGHKAVGLAPEVRF